jgi:XTP/dITP diphosphohydrolase
VALVEHGAVRFETCGTVEGWIADGPTGSAGFGYDPIFYYPPYQRTLAQVSADEKAAVSHRGVAFRELKKYLEKSESQG